jgi:hypothetical protein
MKKFIQVLWERHYSVGVTGSFYGDMAHAFTLMLNDRDCGPLEREQLLNAIRVHCRLERASSHAGRRWFCERFENTH